MTFPLPLETLIGKPLMFVVFAIIGFGFGYVLESSGFGNSKKLAAQFYFTELTVLKVMFGAIVTAMVLLFTMVGLGLLDYNQVWVNPTYLWSGILGGLIMGVGFIVGGFCPGTSLVGMMTGKLDGLFFVLGGLFGIFLFGETERFYDLWWNYSGYLGRLTIQDWLNLPTGVVVTAVVCMALFMFWGAEHLERIFGGKDLKREPKLRVAGAAGLLALAVTVIFLGDAGPQEKWARVAPVQQPALEQRTVQIHPGELLASMGNDLLRTTLIDVRPEADYNLFHIRGAQNIPLDELAGQLPGILANVHANSLYVVVSNDEAAASEAWKLMIAESVPNVYILEGGVNHWIATFATEDAEIQPATAPPGSDRLGYAFPAALGDRYECARPSPHEWTIEFTPKIKLQIKRDKSGGGCG
jgi:rhodanese-related sulfurtransferase